MVAKQIVRVLCFMVLFGCAGVKINSIVEPGYTSKISDIAVIISGPDGFTNKSAIQYIDRRLDRYKIAHADYFQDPEKKAKLTLDGDAEQSEINDFIGKSAKTLVLFISFDEVYLNRGYLSSAHVSMLIRDISAGKNVWKSAVELSSSSPFGEGPAMMNGFFDGVMERLVHDGLIDPIAK